MRVNAMRLLGLRELSSVRLGAGSGVLMDDARLGGLVHRGAVGDSSRFGGNGVAQLDGLVQLLVESLQAGFDTLVADGETGRFTGGFDSRFGIGHSVFRLLSRTETQTSASESRAIHRTHR